LNFDTRTGAELPSSDPSAARRSMFSLTRDSTTRSATAGLPRSGETAGNWDEPREIDSLGSEVAGREVELGPVVTEDGLGNDGELTIRDETPGWDCGKDGDSTIIEGIIAFVGTGVIGSD
jgi:hypothetical protein